MNKKSVSFKMLNYFINHLIPAPDIAINMNCATRLAINLPMFNLGEHDELIFTIKNYDYIDSPNVFTYTFHKGEEDENGEVFFKIPVEASKKLVPDAFYNFTVFTDANNPLVGTEYKKITHNGKIRLEYGAHDLKVISGDIIPTGEIVGIRFELISEDDNVEEEL